MHDEDTLDRMIRTALTWEADRAARTQPSLGAAAGRLADRLEPEPTHSRPRVVAFPGLERSRWRTQPILIMVLLLAALLFGLAVVGSLSRPTVPIHTSDRHGYTLALPDHSWRVVERPGTWEPGAFIEAVSPGVDYLEQVGPDGTVIEDVYVYLSSQPVPDFMTFDDWASGHDAVNDLWQPCFELQGAHEARIVDGKAGRTGVYRCEDFGGVAWATVQTLVMHRGRGYAIYLWPGAQGTDMPPKELLVAQSDEWLARISFTDG
jgi:hypothetical protein